MQISKAALLALCVSLGLGACASRGPDRPPPRGAEGPQRSGFEGFAVKPVALIIASMDADGDRRVQMDEFENGVQLEWQALSVGAKPGALVFANWSKDALGAPDALPSFITFDRNLDGVISEEEFSGYLFRLFAEMDRNSDKAIDRSELVFRIERQQGPGMGEGGGRPPGGGGGRPPPR